MRRCCPCCCGWSSTRGSQVDPNSQTKQGPFYMCRRASTQVLFLRKAELGFFHFLQIVTGWLVPCAGQKIPVQPGWYLPPQKIPLAENRFLQAGNGAENTKEKSRQRFTTLKNIQLIMNLAMLYFFSFPFLLTLSITFGFSSWLVSSLQFHIWILFLILFLNTIWTF